MCAGVRAGRFSRHWCSCWSAGWRLDIEDPAWGRDGELGKQVLLAAGEGGELLERAGGAGEGAGVQAGELAADDSVAPGVRVARVLL
jgi:hypothetical protein